MPEYLTCVDKSAELAAHCIEWLEDDAAKSRHVARLAELRERYAAGGASDRAAEYIAAVVAPAVDASRRAA
jgi:hypothetical protein